MGKFTSNKNYYRVDPITGVNRGSRGENEMEGGQNSDDPQMYSETNPALVLNDNYMSLFNITDPLELFNKMDSVDGMERDFAFRTISEQVLENPSFRATLLQNVNITRIIKRLIDDDVQVRVSAIGTIRNLIIIEENCIERLVGELNILEMLLMNLSQGFPALIALKEEDVKKDNSLEIQQVIYQTLTVISNLCEYSEKAFEMMSNQLMNGNAFLLFFQIIQRFELFGNDFLNSIAEFLAIITDDNPVALNSKVDQNVLMAVFGLIKNRDSKMSMKLKTLVSITLLNLGSSLNRELVIKKITPVLLESMELSPIQGLPEIINITKQCKELRAKYDKEEMEREKEMDTMMDGNEQQQEKESIESESATTDQVDLEMSDKLNSNGNRKKDVNGDNNNGKKKGKENVEVDPLEALENQLNEKIAIWKDNLYSQQISIEIFTNILIEDNANEDSTTNYDDEDDKFLDIEDGNTQGDQTEELSGTMKFLVVSDLPVSLMKVIELVSSNDLVSMVKDCSEILSLVVSLKQLYKRSITCLSNLLIIYIPTSPQGIQESMWSQLIRSSSTLINSQTNEINQNKMDIELMELITSSLWSLMRKNPAIGFNQVLEIRNLIVLSQKASTTERIRTNIIGILGISGQKPQCLQEPQILKDIGNCLLLALKDPSAEIISESLNSIFDIYAEPHVNQICKELNLITHLESFVPVIRNKLKSDKKKLERSLLDRLDESRINLTRFINYKKSQK
ncbi:armadillo repeat-containing protein [Tieghemostelium lacteum]|uniref:Armadillo repeat-containing protein n=1 Tax=Tieghemostelium lacteum TaxID=361077 RepID=A0A151ZFS4_TIELA|nr:armadillo repeat-containing protein [Tieghemostelium lacteum]|eukprot:KYQ92818.1 armadillo repeat-containing protein [Tieghemostelium lacteum]